MGKALWLQLPKYKKSTGIAPASRRIPSRSKSKIVADLLYEKIKRAWWKLSENWYCRGLCKSRTILASDVHHYRGRTLELLCDTRFWLPVCRKCHTWIDANRNEARKLGLLCKSGYNDMRRPKEFEKAWRIYIAGKKLGGDRVNPEPKIEDYDLSEWEANQIKKAIK